MKIASLGDLHLGPSERRDRYGQRAELLEAFCAYLESTHDLIVLVGDIYQADYGWRLGPDAGVRSDIKKRFSSLIHRWVDSKYVLLTGNHDDLHGLSEFTIEKDDTVVHYIHGHQFDPLSRRLGSKLTMWAVARLRQLSLARLCAIVEEQLLEALHRVATGDEHLGLVDRAQELLEDAGLDIVVMGHTHRPACIRTGSGVYANSGACHSGLLAFVSVDTAVGTVELRKFSPQNGSMCLERVHSGNVSTGDRRVAQS